MRPSSSGPPTPDHDRIYLWLAKKANRQAILEFARGKGHHNGDKFLEERFTLGYIIHGIRRTSNKWHQWIELSEVQKGRVDALIKTTDPWTILIDVKPTMTRISAMIDQMHSYEYLLYDENKTDTNTKWHHGEIISVVVTISTNREYDEMLNSSGIYVYHTGLLLDV